MSINISYCIYRMQMQLKSTGELGGKRSSRYRLRCARPWRMPCEPWRCLWVLVVGRTLPLRLMPSLFASRWLSPSKCFWSLTSGRNSRKVKELTKRKEKLLVDMTSMGAEEASVTRISVAHLPVFGAVVPIYLYPTQLKNKQRKSQEISRVLTSQHLNKHIEKYWNNAPRDLNDHKQPAMERRQGPHWHRSFQVISSVCLHGFRGCCRHSFGGHGTHVPLMQSKPSYFPYFMHFDLHLTVSTSPFMYFPYLQSLLSLQWSDFETLTFCKYCKVGREFEEIVAGSASWGHGISSSSSLSLWHFSNDVVLLFSFVLFRVWHLLRQLLGLHWRNKRTMRKNIWQGHYRHVL